MNNPFDTVTEFENEICKYVNSPYAISTDSCSHAIFMCGKYINLKHDIDTVILPKHTYISVPMQFIHAGYKVKFADIKWSGIYTIEPTNIIDAACRLTQNMYISGSFMCISFQFQKILSTIRGGMILTDNKEFANWAKDVSHDGRDMNTSYNKDNIKLLGYHFFMTPETASLGLEKFKNMPDQNDDCADYTHYHDISYVNNLKII
tara:strand:- start:141 stop:755 length:615 start_codon:yes stop_codon:yes gene_type:complete